MKTCSKCGETKELSEWGRNKASYDGLSVYCLLCERARDRARKEKRAKSRSEYNREYRAKNKVSLRARKQKYHQDNLEATKSRQKAWRLANPKTPEDNFKENSRRRAALNSCQSWAVSPRELRQIRESACAHCGARDDIHIDHIIPIVKGGAHSIGNLQPLCAPCNTSKGSKFLAEWRYQYLAPGAREAQEAQSE